MLAPGARPPSFAEPRWRPVANGLLVGLARLYFAYLAIWLSLHVLFDDRWWWLDSLTVVVEYAFLPLPLVFLIARVVRRRETWIGLALSTALGMWMYGGLFLPRAASVDPQAPVLTVMTYNLLGSVLDPAPALQTIRASGADVIGLQELNPQIAQAIQRELATEYPYQVLDPRRGTSGVGTISRYPMRPAGEPFGGSWQGTPHVLDLDFRGHTIKLVNGHATPRSMSGRNVERWNADRRQDAEAVAELARRYAGPFIATTDLNATDQGVEYRSVTGQLQDAWRSAGWGPGHSWSARPQRGWWFRIDYVFASRHFQVLSAEHGQWDGHSDHRPVIARLALVP
jgi:vancomycin resistance protein VanJ